MLAKSIQRQRMQMAQFQMRGVHTIFRPAQEVIGNETAVPVYSSAEFSQYEGISNRGTFEYDV